MRIGITGHTRGLGKAIATHLASHEIVGLSRSNGFDLATDIDSVVEVALTCDLFFNNAHVELAQCALIEQLAGKIPLVTSGSIAANYPHLGRYWAEKFKLEQTHKVHRKKTELPMLLLKMGLMENVVEQFPTSDPLLFDEVLSAIDFWMLNPRVSMIEFENAPDVYRK